MESSSSSPRCPGCQRPLEPGRAQGLCPRCLLARAAFATEPGTAGPPLPVPALETVAAAFPQLEVRELIGRGGMGVVYLARQKSLDRLVALKLLAPGRERDPAFAERFAREARALAALSHPNIVTVHDFGFAASPAGGEAGGFYFLLMEFVDGVNLRQAMQAGRFTPEQALAIVPPVCAALQFAHERGIVHRDIKPENLLLDKDGRIKIADFGIAKMLGAPASDPAERSAEHRSAGGPATVAAQQCSALREEPTLLSAAGTPQYMAPEQREAPRRSDHRADIYSLGVVLYELLTGELPGTNFQPPSHKVQIDVRLDEIVLRALAVRPELRYATAGEFGTQLDTVIATPRTQAASTSGPSSIPRLLKSGNGILTTPEALATFEGQFLIRRNRGQLLLDERQLTHARDDATTVIPLIAIRDVSIDQYPATMNPAGVDLLSVTYDDQGLQKQIYISPMDGWFALPSTWNARVADWHAALRNAVAQATGKEPAMTPRGQVAVPKGHGGVRALMAMAYAVPMLATFLVLQLSGGRAGSGGFVKPVLFVAAMLVGGYLGQRLIWRLIRRPDPTAAPTGSPWNRVVGTLLLLGALALGWGLVASRNARAHAETQRIVVKLQVAKSQEADLQAQLAEHTRRTANPPDETQRSHDQIGRNRLQNELDAAIQRGQELERALAQGVPQPNRAGALLAVLPLLLGGIWLLLRTGPAASPDTKPRRWMRWLGGGLLALGLPLGGLGTWIAYQIAHDSSWNPAPAEAFFTFAIWITCAACLIGGLALIALARPRPVTAGPRRGCATALVILLLIMLPVLLGAVVVWSYVSMGQPAPPAVATPAPSSPVQTRP